MTGYNRYLVNYLQFLENHPFLLQEPHSLLVAEGCLPESEMPSPLIQEQAQLAFKIGHLKALLSVTFICSLSRINKSRWISRLHINCVWRSATPSQVINGTAPESGGGLKTQRHSVLLGLICNLLQIRTFQKLTNSRA